MRHPFLQNCFAIAFIVLVLTSAIAAQSNAATGSEAPAWVRGSQAFGVLLLRETELKAELDSLLADYTDEYPKVKEIRSELELLDSEIDRLVVIKAADAGRLSESLGRLILGKVTNQVKLRDLIKQYADEHPSVKRQRKKVEVYESAIRTILK